MQRHVFRSLFNGKVKSLDFDVLRSRSNLTMDDNSAGGTIADTAIKFTQVTPIGHLQKRISSQGYSSYLVLFLMMLNVTMDFISADSNLPFVGQRPCPPFGEAM